MNLPKKIEFIGTDELNLISSIMNLPQITDPPPIPYALKDLKNLIGEYILVLGQSKHADGRKLTINSLRQILGIDPEKSEPCFYNQDWYINEMFAKNNTLKFQWYLIEKKIRTKTRGSDPEKIKKELNKEDIFPSAILTAFTFFAYYFINREILWKHDYIWCSDFDSNGDRIYTGRYKDPRKINKNGFSIHRFLTINDNYGLAPQFKGGQ